jgi:hypothetical protein
MAVAYQLCRPLKTSLYLTRAHNVPPAGQCLQCSCCQAHQLTRPTYFGFNPVYSLLPLANRPHRTRRWHAWCITDAHLPFKPCCGSISSCIQHCARSPTTTSNSHSMNTAEPATKPYGCFGEAELPVQHDHTCGMLRYTLCICRSGTARARAS